MTLLYKTLKNLNLGGEIMKGAKRFEVVSSEGAIESYRVIVDKETGVNYLYISNGTSGGLTVLLDSGGKPIITKVK